MRLPEADWTDATGEQIRSACPKTRATAEQSLSGLFTRPQWMAQTPDFVLSPRSLNARGQAPPERQFTEWIYICFRIGGRTSNIWQGRCGKPLIRQVQMF